MKKRILIHTTVFSPDGVSAAYLYNDIALKLYSLLTADSTDKT